jgi:hypothetical protein
MKSSEKITLLPPEQSRGGWAKFISTVTSRIQATENHEHDTECAHQDGESDPCCRRHAVVLPGYGKRDYPFPTPEELLAQCIAYVNALRRAHEEQNGGSLEIGQEELGSESDVGTVRSRKAARRSPFDLIGIPRRSRNGRRRGHHVFNASVMDRAREIMAANKKPAGAASKDKAAAGESETTGVTVEQAGGQGPVLRIAAGTLAHIMHEGRDKAAIARQFDPLRGAVNWALTGMPPQFRPAKYRDTAASLKDQLDNLVSVYRQVLPPLVQWLSAQWPDASEEEMLEAAVAILNEQLAEILMVLSIWTDSFAQRRDGMYTQLEYVHFVVEQALRLFQTGDAAAREEKGIKTHAFHVGDVFMARFSEQGPATIPGGRGPVGAHAIEVPFDEQDVIVLYTPLYTHEFRHDYWFDVASDAENLPDSMTKAVVNALKKADKEGKFKFSSDKLLLGKQAVPMISMITQILAQTLPETDADIAGGFSLTGEAYAYSMLAVFSAFNIRGQNPVAVNRMLRHASVYGVGQQGELVIEPHLPDYIRVYAVAAALELLGFKDAANDVRRLADQAAGIPKPTHIIWKNADPNSKFQFEIKILVEDLKQVLPVVVDAILNAPLPALNGLSTSNMVNWNAKRQAKVDALVKNIVSGSSEIPWEMGDFWATYVAAAVTKAAWVLWTSGNLPPIMVTQTVEALGRQMMDKVKIKFEKMEAEAEAAVAQHPEPEASAPPSANPARESAATAGGDTDDDAEADETSDVDVTANSDGNAKS